MSGAAAEAVRQISASLEGKADVLKLLGAPYPGVTSLGSVLSGDLPLDQFQSSAIGVIL